jgi:hypothetical protein
MQFLKKIRCFRDQAFLPVGQSIWVRMGRKSITSFPEIPSTLTIKRYLQQAKDYLHLAGGVDLRPPDKNVQTIFD